MIIMLRMPETNGAGRKRSRQHCQLSLLRCWSPPHVWLSSVGTGYAVASGPLLGRAPAQRPGRSKQRVTLKCGGRNELLGLVEAVTGHCFHLGRTASLFLQWLVLLTSPGSPLWSFIIAVGYQVMAHLPSHLCAYNPGYSFALTPTHTSRHLLDTPQTVQRPPSALARLFSL